MEPRVEAPSKQPARAAEFLESLLADEYVLCVRTRDARRNVNGINITQLRKLFGYHCNYLDSVVADLSRRVGILGQLAPVTFAHSMKATRLRKHNEKLRGQNQIIEALLDDHESIILWLNKEHNDVADVTVLAATTDLMSGLLRQHMEMAGDLRDLL